MSKVVYKQRHIQSSLNKASGKNYAHILYIAKRHGVLRRDGSKSGLFGKLEAGSKMMDFDDPKVVAKEVYKNTNKGVVMLRGIISFKPETADELGLKTMDDWKRYAERMVIKLKEGNNIKTEDLAYVCAVHLPKGHPHIHYAFWDKERRSPNYFIKPEKVNEIRQNIIRETFRDKLSLLHKEQDEALSGIRSNKFKGLSLGGRMAVNRAIKIAKKNLPKTGRLSYKFLPPNAKEAMRNLVRVTLANSPALSKYRRRFVESKLAEHMLYGGTESEDDVIRRFEEQVDKVLANSLLPKLKDMNPSSDISKSSAFQVISALLSAVTSIASASGGKTQNSIGKKLPSGFINDKSKESRRIIAKKLKEATAELDL